MNYNGGRRIAQSVDRKKDSRTPILAFEDNSIRMRPNPSTRVSRDGSRSLVRG